MKKRSESMSPAPQSAAAAGGSTQFDRRRQLIKAALMAAPLIITLRGKPAHALTSLGSVQIPYGPQLYVTQADIDQNNGTLKKGDLHKPISFDKNDPSKFFVVQDDRRNQAPQSKSFSRSPEPQGKGKK